MRPSFLHVLPPFINPKYYIIILIPSSSSVPPTSYYHHLPNICKPQKINHKMAAEPDDTEPAETSLRHWIDRPGRAVDRLECLHLFHQIVDIVSLAHSHSVTVGHVRPSCLLVSPFNRVVFIESDSSSTSGLGSENDNNGSNNNTSNSNSYSHSRFPLKQVLMLEFEWYTSPEEGEGSCNSSSSTSSLFASDIYQLGVLLFELFCTFDSMDEKLRTMSNLRHRVLPPRLLLKWPKEAGFCLWLLHPQPKGRPRMSEVLQSEFLNETRNNLDECEAAIKLNEEIEDQELLLGFLQLIQKSKHDVADKLHDTICFLSTDIEEVLNQNSQLVLVRKGSSSILESEEDEHSTVVEKLDQALPYPPLPPPIELDSSCSGSRKRFRPPKPKNYNEKVEDESNYSEEIHNDEGLSELPVNETCPNIQENVVLKSCRLMKKFKKFEAAYLSTRCRSMKPSGKFMNQQYPVIPSTSIGRGYIARTEGSWVDSIISNKEGHSGRRKIEWINPFLESLCKCLSFSKLKVRANVKQQGDDVLNTSNLVCSLGFDRDNHFFATAGANRKIKIFECDMILGEKHRDIHYPVVEMQSRSKITCISWNSYIESQIASSDFEGVVQVWDITRSQVFLEMREHERRVWSIDYSPSDPMKLASGSDDGDVKLWNINQAGSIGTIKTKANVCAVQFPPEDSARTLVIGSADHNIYCFDLRNLRVPYCTFIGHTKTVSYVKYLDSTTIVSASTDSSLKLWDLSTSTSTSNPLDNSVLTFTGHTNLKNFVGLSIYDGYIATGSETNEVFVYHKAFPMPVLSYKFNTLDPISGREVADSSQFVSSVCWRGQSSMLLAANSSGNIKVLEMA